MEPKANHVDIVLWMTEVISPCSERFSTTVRTKKGPTAVTETAQDFSLLFVDDEVDFLETIEEFFGDLGYTVYTARDGQEALPRVKEHLPRTVFLDIHAPYGW